MVKYGKGCCIERPSVNYRDSMLVFAVGSGPDAQCELQPVSDEANLHSLKAVQQCNQCNQFFIFHASTLPGSVHRTIKDSKSDVIPITQLSKLSWSLDRMVEVTSHGLCCQNLRPVMPEQTKDMAAMRKQDCNLHALRSSCHSGDANLLLQPVVDYCCNSFHEETEVMNVPGKVWHCDWIKWTLRSIAWATVFEPPCCDHVQSLQVMKSNW